MTISPGGAVTYNAPDGSTAAFAPLGGGAFVPPADLAETFAQNTSSGTYTLTLQPSGTEAHFTSTGQLSSETDNNGNAISLSYNSDGTLATITDTQGRVLTVSETAGRVTSITDPTGRNLSYGYDSVGDLSSYTDAMGHHWYYGYASPGQLSTITDPDGNVTAIAYASPGVVSSITYASGTSAAATTDFAYHSPGASACVSSTTQACSVATDANRHSSIYYFDPAGRPTMATDANGNNRGATYDSSSNVTSVTDAMSSPDSTTFTYNSLNSMIRSNAASPTQGVAGSILSYSYTNPNLPYVPTATKNGEGNTTTYAYDANGNVTSVTDATNHVSTQGIQGTNASCEAKPGELCYSTTPAGNETTYAYDSAGNQTAVTPPSPLGATTATYCSVL